MNLALQVARLLALCVLVTAVEGMRVRVRGRRQRPRRPGQRQRPRAPIFLAVPGTEAVPVISPAGVQEVLNMVAAARRPASSPPSARPAQPDLPAQPSFPAEPSFATEPSFPPFPPAPSVSDRPAVSSGDDLPRAPDGFGADFFSGGDTFGSSLPQFPDISSIFNDAAVSRRRAGGSEPGDAGRSRRRWGDAGLDSDSDSDPEQQYADLYYRASFAGN
ncbi:predicted GPI-anchored protein 58 [Pollicipes pollicipes]|uniref:predicted GPI-anchored protein 58 n=1 Tax=Pollicipes pollicipes TaxID=41117 RepID=UPI0018855842|nr:predicted GPI-anchored protein 58 [Pollicipes pollicipes]